MPHICVAVYCSMCCSVCCSVCCNVLQCVAVYVAVLQVSCPTYLLQCFAACAAVGVAVCCSILQCMLQYCDCHTPHTCCSVLQRVLQWMLQFVALCFFIFMYICNVYISTHTYTYRYKEICTKTFLISALRLACPTHRWMYTFNVYTYIRHMYIYTVIYTYASHVYMM